MHRADNYRSGSARAIAARPCSAIRAALAAVAAMMALATLAGCARPVTTAPRGQFAGNQGGAWEAVLPVPRINEPAVPLAFAPEFGRRDEQYAQAPQPYQPPDTWTARARGDDRPRIEDLRRLTLGRQPDVIFFYRQPRHRHHDQYGW